jgi:hypothetical protein
MDGVCLSPTSNGGAARMSGASVGGGVAKTVGGESVGGGGGSGTSPRKSGPDTVRRSKFVIESLRSKYLR